MWFFFAVVFLALLIGIALSFGTKKLWVAVFCLFLNVISCGFFVVRASQFSIIHVSPPFSKMGVVMLLTAALFFGIGFLRWLASLDLN